MMESLCVAGCLYLPDCWFLLPKLIMLNRRPC